MYYDFRVKIPDEKGKIYTKTIKGVVYVNYEHNMDLHEKDADGMVGKFNAAFSRGGWC